MNCQRAAFRIARRRAEVISGVGLDRRGRRAADGRRLIDGLGLATVPAKEAKAATAANEEVKRM